MASNYVNLPQPLDGGHEAYAVILTPLNSDAGTYVASVENDGDGKFYRFLVVNQDEADFYYLVVSKGFKPTVS